MLNSDTRRSAAWEAQFRLQVPNSSARGILVIPLDEESAKLTADLSEQSWRNAKFVPFTAFGEAWRTALDETEVDLVVIIGIAGQNLSQAIAIGEKCIVKNVKISGVLMRPGDLAFADMSASLRSVRPWTHTLAVIAEQDYLPGLLHALGA